MTFYIGSSTDVKMHLLYQFYTQPM